MIHFGHIRRLTKTGICPIPSEATQILENDWLPRLEGLADCHSNAGSGDEAVEGDGPGGFFQDGLEEAVQFTVKTFVLSALDGRFFRAEEISANEII